MKSTQIFGLVAMTAMTFYVVGIAITQVGSIPECSSNIFTWWGVIRVISIIILPFLLGMLVGKNDPR